MLGIFVDILGPVFLVVLVGVVAGTRLRLDTRTLASVGYWILGPVFMFDALARPDLDLDVLVRMILAAGAGVIAAIGVGVVMVARSSRSVRGAVATTAVFGNTGNFGLAIVAFSLGEQALPLAAVVMVILNTVGILIGVAAGAGQRSSFLQSLRVALTAPMTLAVPLAVVVNVTDTALPLFLDRAVGIVADALIPMMLLTLGMQLASMGMPSVGRAVVAALAAKLAVAPAVAWAVGVGVGLSGDGLGVVVLQMAMPAAVLSAMVAMEHDLEPDLVTTVVLTGTIVSVATLPVVIALVV